MSSRALSFPTDSVAHLSGADLASHEELSTLAVLEGAGLTVGVVALPGAIEESFYRLNNLPPRLARLYQGLDPRDPDEDILEEAEEAAMRLLAESYLLDDLIDAIYASLVDLPPKLVVRRAGSAGEEVVGARAALLAVKRRFRDDWTAAALLQRLSSTGHLGVDAQPVLVHAADAGDGVADTLLERAAAVLGRQVRLVTDPRGAITRVW